MYEGWMFLKGFEYSDTYTFVGLDNYEMTSAHEILLQNISNNGDALLHEDFFIDSLLGTTFAFNSKAVVNDGNTIFLAGYSQYDAYKFYPMLMKLSNSTLDTTYLDIFHSLIEDKQVLYQVIERIQACLYVLGRVNDYNNKFTLSFHKMDTLGNLIFSREYGTTSSNLYADIKRPLQICPTNDGGFVFTFEEPITTSSVINQNAYCLKVDSLGNELWRCAFGHYDTLNYRPFVFPKPDGNFLFTYSDPYIYNTINPGAPRIKNDSSTIWIGEMNADGNVLWKRSLSWGNSPLDHMSYYVNDVYQSETGEIYLAGINSSYTGKVFLIKIDTQYNVQWVNYYECFPENTDADWCYTKAYSLTATSDGGFIMAGEYLSTDSEMFPGGVQSSLVIKVDECGCLDEGCNPDCYTSNAHVQYIRMNQLEIFPNPASDFIRINFDAQAGRLRIINQQAQLCIDKTYNAGAELDLSDLTSGLYTVRVNADGKFYWGQFVKE
jgi:hypothetical protein